MKIEKRKTINKIRKIKFVFLTIKTIDKPPDKLPRKEREDINDQCQELKRRHDQ